MSRVTGNFDMGKFRERVIAACGPALYQAAMVGANEAKFLVNKGSPGVHSNPGNYPNVQTGELLRSIRAQGPTAAEPLTARYGSGKEAPQGRWMEYGVQNITAKRTRFLPVPINYEAEKMLRRLGGTSLRTQKLKPIKKDGKAFLVEMTPTGKREKKGGAVFVLKRSVTIAPRPWLVPSAKLAAQEMKDTFRRVFAAEMAKGGRP